MHDFWYLPNAPQNQIKLKPTPTLIPRLQIPQHTAFARSRNEVADSVDCLIRSLKLGDHLSSVLFADYCDHTDACVKCSAHLGARDVTCFFEPFEDGREGPSCDVDPGWSQFVSSRLKSEGKNLLRSQMLRQHSRDVLRQATTSDMCQTFQKILVGDLQQ